VPPREQVHVRHRGVRRLVLVPHPAVLVEGPAAQERLRVRQMFQRSYRLAEP